MKQKMDRSSESRPTTENHYSNFRVYYEDTDAGGVVYHANYLKFMERARTDWLASFGCMPQQPADSWGIIFAIRHVTLDFVKPARLGDSIRVSVRLDAIRGASMEISQSISGVQGELVRGRFRIACVDAENLAVRRIPGELKDKLI